MKFYSCSNVHIQHRHILLSHKRAWMTRIIWKILSHSVWAGHLIHAEPVGRLNYTLMYEEFRSCRRPSAAATSSPRGHLSGWSLGGFWPACRNTPEQLQRRWAADHGLSPARNRKGTSCFLVHTISCLDRFCLLRFFPCSRSWYRRTRFLLPCERYMFYRCKESRSVVSNNLLSEMWH